MPKRSKAETDIFVTVAAELFATHTRDAKEIARLLNTTDRTVHGTIILPVGWHCYERNLIRSCHPSTVAGG